MKKELNSKVFMLIEKLIAECQQELLEEKLNKKELGERGIFR